MYLDGVFALFGRMLQVSGLLALFDTAVLNEAAVIIGVKDFQWLGDHLVGQKYPLPARPIIPIVPLAHHHGVERVALKVLALLGLGVLFRAVLVIGRHRRDAHHFGFQPFRPALFALPVRHRVYGAGDHACPCCG